MPLHQKLAELRKEKGITQEHLAERLGVSRQAVAKWEVGASQPDIANLIELSDYYHVSIDALVKENDPPCGLTGGAGIPDAHLDAMLDFLLAAKVACYAGGGGEAMPSRPGSHDLHHADGEWLYIDSYLGSERFSGEEAIWHSGQPAWAMNYTGRVLAPGFSGDFLKEALSLVPRESPYRGPMVHHHGDHSYHCIVHGEFEWFDGYEEIYCRDVKVYECFFHGGVVK